MPRQIKIYNNVILFIDIIRWVLPPHFVNTYFAFGSYARFKPGNMEFCNLIVYLIIIMLLYRDQLCSKILLCLI